MKKKIVIPPPIQLYNPATNEVVTTAEPITMKKWVVDTILADPTFGNDSNGKRGRKAAKIVARIAKTFNDLAQTEVFLREEDWEAGRDVLENPGTNWNLVIMYQLEPFFDAWLGAATVEE